MAAYKIAVRQGISPVDFWALTPYQTRHAMGAQRDTSLAWQIARMIRAKKLPDHGALFREKKDMADLKSTLAGFKGK